MKEREREKGERVREYRENDTAIRSHFSYPLFLREDRRYLQAVPEDIAWFVFIGTHDPSQ